MDLITMAHPDLIFVREAFKDQILLHNGTSCSTVFTRRSAVDFSAEVIADQLHAVTDPQHGNAQIENARIAFGGTVFVDAVWSARQD